MPVTVGEINRDRESKRYESARNYNQRLYVAMGVATVIGGLFGFIGGISYGQWLSEPISVLEQKLNEDNLPDLRILDRELNERKYVGTNSGEYRQTNYKKAGSPLPANF